MTNHLNSPLRLTATLCLCLLIIALTGTTASAQGGSPITLGPPPSLKLPTPVHLKLRNGVGVVLMENHKVPLVQIEVMVRGGSAIDPAGKTGLAGMTADMMEEGAGGRNSLEFADAIDFLGGSISAYAGMHSSGVNLFIPLSKLDSAMGLFADMVMRPMFPQSEVDRLKNERLTTLIQWHDEPRAIASALFNKTLYGDSHAYGTTTLGDENSIRSFTVDDLRQFHARTFTPSNATVIVVGDVSADRVMKLLDRYFGDWKGEALDIPEVPAVPQVASREIYLVDKPGAAQSEIRIGRIGVERGSPDYYSTVVLNTILGGSFASRLNQNLRERNGYTYGAGSRFLYRLSPGPFLASSAVQTDVTDKALVEFFNELTAIREPVSGEELSRAGNYVALDYPNSFETISGIAGELAELVMYGLPDDYFNTYVGNILGVTGDQVQAAAKKYIDPEKMAVIVVGDRSKIEAGIAALGLGTIHNLTIDDVLGPAPSTDGGK
jgi:zinc protease